MSSYLFLYLVIFALLYLENRRVLWLKFGEIISVIGKTFSTSLVLQWQDRSASIQTRSSNHQAELSLGVVYLDEQSQGVCHVTWTLTKLVGRWLAVRQRRWLLLLFGGKDDKTDVVARNHWPCKDATGWRCTTSSLSRFAKCISEYCLMTNSFPADAFCLLRLDTPQYPIICSVPDLLRSLFRGAHVHAH